MLEIKVPAVKLEMYDEAKEEFIYINTKETILRLEHSLVSLAKWESKWKKPYLTKTEKTNEEILDYIECMTLNQNVDPDIYKVIDNNNIKKIIAYIEDPMTATTFSQKDKKGNNGEQITAEIIYYWMVALNIPFECKKWHLNRLLTLIRVCNIKNQPPKKMSKNELMNRNRALNEQRRKQLNTKG